MELVNGDMAKLAKITQRILSDLNSDEFCAMYVSYLGTADWTDADKNFPDVDLTPEFKAQAKIDCRHFIQQVYEIPASENFDWGQVGQDFWLTRNGHGAGFRDRPEMYDGRPNAERLDKIARAFGVHYAEFL